MRTFKLSVTVLALAFLLVSICYGSNDHGVSGAGSAVSAAFPDETAVQQEIAGAGEQVAYLPGVEMAVTKVRTDKGLYKSADPMRIAATVHCSDDIEGVRVTATGISGKMNIEKAVDLKAGDNIVTFDYRLPRCNVCGGIRPGTHSCTVEAEYGEVSSQDTVSVEIIQ